MAYPIAVALPALRRATPPAEFSVWPWPRAGAGVFSSAHRFEDAMKFTVDAAPLRALVRDARPVAGKRGVLPITDHLLLTAKDGLLTVYATDLVLTIEASAPCNVAVEGCITVPFAHFSALVDKLTGDIELTTNGLDSVLKSGRSKYTLRGLEPGDFPLQFNAPVTAGVAVPRAELALGIAATIWGADDDTPAAFTGALQVKLTRGRLSLAATNGYRMGTWTTDQAEGDFVLTVPKRAIIELAKMLKIGSADHLIIHNLVNRIGFQLGDRYMTAALLDTSFPAFEQIIPARSSMTAEVNRTTLVDALDRALIVASAQEASIIEIHIENGEIVLKTGASGTTEGVETVAAAWNGEAFTIFLNGGYLRELIRSLVAETLTLGFNGPLAPVKFTSTDEPRFLAILMPLNKAVAA
jgi:DNA polymerase-3 subunit beta